MWCGLEDGDVLIFGVFENHVIDYEQLLERFNKNNPYDKCFFSCFLDIFIYLLKELLGSIL